MTKNLSLNQLIKFSGASERKKLSIIRQQKKPRTVQVAPYRTARAACTNFFIKHDATVIKNAIENLQRRTPRTEWAARDVKNSISALRSLMSIHFPDSIIKCYFNRTKEKHLLFSGVDIIISPDLILEFMEEGVKYIGAVKFYISKNELSLEEGIFGATVLKEFLDNVKEDGTRVSNNHCVCVDVMNGRIFTAQNESDSFKEKLNIYCNEINRLWDAA